jgi:hypothetical protein
VHEWLKEYAFEGLTDKKKSVNIVLGKTAVFSQIHTKQINTLCAQNVPRSKHCLL